MSSDNNADTFNMNQKNKNILKKSFLKYENFFSWITLNKKNILQNKTINSGIKGPVTSAIGNKNIK